MKRRRGGAAKIYNTKSKRQSFLFCQHLCKFCFIFPMKLRRNGTFLADIQIHIFGIKGSSGYRHLPRVLPGKQPPRQKISPWNIPFPNIPPWNLSIAENAPKKKSLLEPLPPFEKYHLMEDTSLLKENYPKIISYWKFLRQSLLPAGNSTAKNVRIFPNEQILSICNEQITKLRKALELLQ